MASPLTRQEILHRLDNDKLIENCDARSCLKPASYEMRVGSYFDTALGRSVDLRETERIALAPSGFLLVGTLEKVNIPKDILGLMYLRSSYARRGFVPWFMGLVDPGYSGTLTVALHNLTRNLLPITGYERICHLVFQQLESPVDDGYEGTYLGSKGATPDLQGGGGDAIKVVGMPVAGSFG